MGRSLAEPASYTIPIKTGPVFGGQATSGSRDLNPRDRVRDWWKRGRDRGTGTHRGIGLERDGDLC